MIEEFANDDVLSDAETEVEMERGGDKIKKGGTSISLKDTVYDRQAIPPASQEMPKKEMQLGEMVAELQENMAASTFGQYKEISEE